MSAFLQLTLWTIVSVHLVSGALPTQGHTLPSPNLLYGNVYLFANQNESRLGECTGDVLYLDYSFTFNSVVAVCNDQHKATIRIFPIEKSQDTKLHANGLHLNSLEAPHTSHFAFDWATGLLYFSEATSISVIDLKQTNCEKLEFYKSHQSATIKGLVVRPDNVSLIWMEHFADLDQMVFMQSSQAGKNVARVFEKNYTRLEDLSYDYVSGKFMVLVTRSKTYQEGYRFSYTNFSEERYFNLSKVAGNSVILLGDSLICLGHLDNYPNESIFKWNLIANRLVEPPIVSRSISNKTFTLIGAHLQRPKVSNRCKNKQSVCSQSKDYCIPHNQTAFICKSYPSTIHSDNSKPPAKWPIFVGVAICLLLILIALIGSVLSKKKVRFYQIRLKSINRVNSSKLDAKTEATEEIAE